MPIPQFTAEYTIGRSHMRYRATHRHNGGAPSQVTGQLNGAHDIVVDNSGVDAGVDVNGDDVEEFITYEFDDEGDVTNGAG